MKLRSRNWIGITLLGVAVVVLFWRLIVAAPAAAGWSANPAHPANNAGRSAGNAGSSTGASLAGGGEAVGGGSTASSGTVVVTLNPLFPSVAKNDIFTVDIQVVAGSQLVDGVLIHLSFHQTYLQVVDDAGNPTSSIQAGSAFSFTLGNTVDTSTELADIYFAACSSPEPGMPRPSGTFTLATIRFKALWGTGGTPTPLDFTDAEPTYLGDLVLDHAENGSVTISGQTPPATPTPTATESPTQTSTPLPTPTPTQTPVQSPTPTRTSTSTSTPTRTNTPVVSCTWQSISFQQGRHPRESYWGVSDTFLSYYEPNLNFGGHAWLQIRDGGWKRALLRFDVTEILPGSIVKTATLQLMQRADWQKHPFNTLTVGAYQVIRHWEEYQATWVMATDSEWVVSGADSPYDRSMVAEDTVTLQATVGWPEFRYWTITQMVQYWVDNPTQNEGLILIPSGDYQEFHLASSDYSALDQRPKLQVLYCPAVPTATPTETTIPTQTRTPTRTYTPTQTNTPTPTKTPTPTYTPTLVPGIIAGQVWNDLNGDGAKDANEPGLAGATLYLYSFADLSTPVRPPITTGADGNFQFADLPPGWYDVVRANPPGYLSTTGDAVDLLLASGATVRVSFGAWMPGTATPTVTRTPTLTPTVTPSATLSLTPTPTRTRTATPTVRHRIFLPIVQRGWVSFSGAGIASPSGGSP